MKAAKRNCTILISLVVFVVPMLGQLDHGVIVSHAGSEIRVSIARTTPLGMVLDEVCREASAQCLGTPQAMAAMVPAQEVHGEETQCLAHAETLRALKPRAEVIVPEYKQTVEVSGRAAFPRGRGIAFL